MPHSDPSLRYPIVPREKMDFDLRGDIPRYWLNNDPFKTRFFDALSILFPEGERFFINCVRDFRDRISDRRLAEEAKAFMRQEGQHTMIHTLYNDRLRQQGIPVDSIEHKVKITFDMMRRYLPATFTLSDTAACEHITALMASGLFDRREIFDRADPRMRAMYAWHAMEEVEHKAVAFDVLRDVARAGYLVRILPMLMELLLFPVFTLVILGIMLKRDGFSWHQRAGLWFRGLQWLYGPGGLFPPLMGRLFAYFKPGFHPWQQAPARNYELWLDTYNRTRDPIAAGDALHAASC